MKATFDHVTPRSREARLGRCAAPEEDPATEHEVAEEVGEEHEQHPPQRVHPIELLLRVSMNVRYSATAHVRSRTHG